MFGSVLHIGNAVNLLSLIVRQSDVDIYTETRTVPAVPGAQLEHYTSSLVLGQRGHCCAVLLWVWPLHTALITRGGVLSTTAS